MIDEQIKRMTEVMVDVSDNNIHNTESQVNYDQPLTFIESLTDSMSDEELGQRIQLLTVQEVEVIDRLMKAYPEPVLVDELVRRVMRRKSKPDQTVGDWLEAKPASTVVSRIRNKLGNMAIITRDESFGEHIVRSYKAGPTLLRFLAPERFIRDYLKKAFIDNEEKIFGDQEQLIQEIDKAPVHSLKASESPVIVDQKPATLSPQNTQCESQTLTKQSVAWSSIAVIILNIILIAAIISGSC